MERPPEEPTPSAEDEEPLTLAGFRVRRFRYVRDSGFVPLFPITAVVGVQPSGKTTLLQALQGLDPALADPYSLATDWPRELRHRRDRAHVACVASFRLGERARVDLVRDGVIEPDACGVRVGRTFGGAHVAETWCGDPSGDLLEHGDRGLSGSEALVDFARQHLPPLLYAGRDALLPGSIAASELEEPGRSHAESGVAALGTLLARAGFESGDLLGDRAAVAAREATASLRREFGQHGFRGVLELRADRGRLLIAAKVGGVLVPAEELPTAVRYRVSIELRLMASFAPPRSGPILLLDGPGRFFRGAERSRMHALFESAVQAGARVVYTARLPFDVDLQHAESLLTLTPSAGGSAVAWHAQDAGQDLVVKGVLALDGRASFQIDELNLVVEGATDALMLKAFDALATRGGEPGLPEGLNVISAGGSREVVAIAEFLGRRDLCVVALLDSDEAGSTAQRELAEARRADPRLATLEPLLLAASAGLAIENATLEDLFPRELYLEVADSVVDAGGRELVGRVGAVAAREDGPEPATNLAQRLSREFEAAGRRFPKAQVAKALATRMAALASPADLPPAMARSVRRLLEVIRGSVDRARAAPGPTRPAER